MFEENGKTQRLRALYCLIIRLILPIFVTLSCMQVSAKDLLPEEVKTPLLTVSEEFVFNEVEYKVIQVLGEGLFSVVYHIVSMESGKNFALKVYENDVALTRASFEQIPEVIQLSKSSDRLVTIIEAGFFMGDLAFLMPNLGKRKELINKANQLKLYFSDVTQENENQIESVFKVYKNMLLALHQLHEQGFVHRDAHLGNFMVDNNMDKIWLIDLVDFARKEGASNDEFFRNLYEVEPFGQENLIYRSADYLRLSMSLFKLLSNESLIVESETDIFIKKYIELVLKSEKFHDQSLNNYYEFMQNKIKEFKTTIYGTLNHNVGFKHLKMLETMFQFMEASIQLGHQKRMQDLAMIKIDSIKQFNDPELTEVFKSFSRSSARQCVQLFN
jgi:serine/threonine protein kinase